MEFYSYVLPVAIDYKDLLKDIQTGPGDGAPG